MERRSFFGLLGGAVAALGSEQQIATGSITSMPDASTNTSMARYTSDMFQPLVGQIFSFHRTAEAKDAPIRLELVDVQSHSSTGDVRQPFSLLFALRSEDATQQSTLHLRHDELESCAWFVNRVIAPGRDAHTPYYEAVFG